MAAPYQAFLDELSNALERHFQKYGDPSAIILKRDAAVQKLSIINAKRQSMIDDIQTPEPEEEEFQEFNEALHASAVHPPVVGGRHYYERRAEVLETYIDDINVTLRKQQLQSRELFDRFLGKFANILGIDLKSSSHSKGTTPQSETGTDHVSLQNDQHAQKDALDAIFDFETPDASSVDENSLDMLCQATVKPEREKPRIEPTFTFTVKRLTRRSPEAKSPLPPTQEHEQNVQHPNTPPSAEAIQTAQQNASDGNTNAPEQSSSEAPLPPANILPIVKLPGGGGES